MSDLLYGEKEELKCKALDLVVPLHLNPHEMWIMTKRIGVSGTSSNMSFLFRVAGLNLRDWARISIIQ